MEVNIHYPMELKINQFNKNTAEDKTLMACSVKTKIQKILDQSHMTELLDKEIDEEVIDIIEAGEVILAMNTADIIVEIEVMIRSILVELKNYFLEHKPHLTA